MDEALEASSQRIRHHLRRPLAGRGDLLDETAGNTLDETDPPGVPAQVRVSGRPAGQFRTNQASFVEVAAALSRVMVMVDAPGFVTALETEFPAEAC